jgi:Neurobeachin/BDCP, DUF4704 alpha solenoid region
VVSSIVTVQRLLDLLRDYYWFRSDPAQSQVSSATVARPTFSEIRKLRVIILQIMKRITR